MDPETFTEAISTISRVWWSIGYTEFCKRAGFREDEYAAAKWRAWQEVQAGLSQFDHATLARIVGLESPARS